MTITVPPGSLVLGAAQFGQGYGNGPDRTAPSIAGVQEILQAAAAVGIHDLDTARAYGDSEAAIGQALADRAAADDLPCLRIVTKVLPLAGAIPSPRAHPDHLERTDQITRVAVDATARLSFATSLATLGQDSVDTVLLHRAADLRHGDGAAVAALRSLVSDGLARRWGVSVSTPEELLDALTFPDLGYVQLPFNLLDRRWLADEVQQALDHRSDVHITARSVLLQGILVGTDPRRWPPVPGVDARATINSLQSLAVQFACTDLLELAIRYVRGHSWIDSIVVGVRRADQLDGPVTAVTAPPLDSHQIAHLHRSIPAMPVDLVDPSRWAGLSPADSPPTPGSSC